MLTSSEIGLLESRHSVCCVTVGVGLSQIKKNWNYAL